MIAPATSTTLRTPPAPSAPGELLLFIDPDATLCREAASYLANLGYRVISSSCSLEAVRMLIAQKHEVDCVIFDSAMPAIDGMPLARALAMVNSKLRLFVLVSETTPALPPFDHSLNIRGRMTKPGSTEALLLGVKHALSSMHPQ